MATATDGNQQSLIPTTTIKNNVITSFPLNPLTTTFSRPADCSGIYASNFLSGLDFSSTCLPKGFNSSSAAYFSPGIACPSGYVSACHDNKGVASITTVTCCPTVADNVALSCVDPSTLHSVWSTLYCTWIAPGGKGMALPITLSANGVTSTPTLGFTSPGGLNAYGIRMVYEATDLDQTTSHPITKSKPSSGSQSTSSAGSQPTSSSGSSSGLSTGAKAAIGVVVPVVVLGLLLGFFLWYRKRRSHTPIASGETEAEKSELPRSELHGNIVQPTELPAVHSGYQDAIELPVHETAR